MKARKRLVDSKRVNLIAKELIWPQKRDYLIENGDNLIAKEK